MKLVIDTNIVFSALIGNKKAQNLILSKEIIAPKIMLVELFKHKEKIQKFAKDDINILLFELTKYIKIIDEDYLPTDYIQKAYNLCKNVDIKDIPFVALSLYLNIPLLTGDKKLINELKKFNFSVKELKDL